MTVDWTWTIEAAVGSPLGDLTGATLCDLTGAELWDLGWNDLSDDVRTDEAIEWDQGINGAGMTDLVAQSGKFSYVLDNSEANSRGTLGAYSIGHTSVISPKWARGCAMRIGITKGGVTDYFLYYLIDTEPTAGAFADRLVSVTGSDWMSKASLAGINKIPVQVAQRPDQVLQTLIDSTNVPPINYVINAEPQTVFAYAMHTESDEKTRLLSVLQKIAQSCGGAIFVDSDNTHGETLRYEHRLMRPARSVVAALNNSMSELSVTWPSDNLVDQVKITYNPGRVDTSDVVLAEITTEIRLAPGESRSIELRYRDPNGLANRVSAISVTAQAAGVDYRASSIERDGGADLNSSLMVSVTAGGNSASALIYNNGSVPMYVNTLQLRGKGLYVYEPLGYSQGAEEPIQPFEYNAPYMSEYFDAKNFAEMLYARMGDTSRPTVGAVLFYADADDTFFGYFRAGHIGYPYTLSETVTGLSSRKFYINRRAMRIERGALSVEWLGEPADVYAYIQCDAGHALDDGSRVLA